MLASALKGFVLTLICLSPAVMADESKFLDLGPEHGPGRQVWLATCASCHGYGIAGAPIPMKPKDWLERVNKDKAELYDHAVNGFFGESDTYMPPKGGNEQLDDAEVRQAVDYMLALASYYITQRNDTQ